jgi:hypothetical protein
LNGSTPIYELMYGVAVLKSALALLFLCPDRIMALRSIIGVLSLLLVLDIPEALFLALCFKYADPLGRLYPPEASAGLSITFST